MNDGRLTLTRRRVLFGAVGVGLAGAGAGAGTMATFLDTESSTGNSISAGTLDLKLDGGDSTVTFLTETSVAPGDSGSSTLQVSNAGSLPGYIDIEVASLTVRENACVGNENSVDGTCGDPGVGDGELQDYLEVRASFQNGPTVFDWGTASNRLAPGTVYDVDYQLDGGSSDTFELEWRLPSAGDDAQSDGVEFALTFSLDQQTDAGA